MKFNENYKGYIFDLDGTILDSSWVWDMVDIKFLGDRGYDVPRIMWNQFLRKGLTRRQFIPLTGLIFMGKNRKNW